MDPDQHGYELPEESLPSLGVEASLEDLRKLKEFLESRGLSTANTRIDRYILYLQRVVLNKEVDAATVFKNSADARFKSATDWSLYVMREVHELMWILRGLRIHMPTGIDEKLKTILSGKDFAALDGDSRSRDAQFELRIASYFCQAGCEVRVDGAATDVVAIADKTAFFIECKRIGSRAQMGKRLIEARKQLQARLPRSFGRRLVAGCVAADVTKVAFSHNGLTLGATNEHSRDVIQEKLVAIANDAQMYPLYQGCSGLLFHWFQIHIPSIILHPPQHVTRFSSYHVLREAVDRKQRRLARVFYGIFEAASKAKDPRELPPKPLVRKKVHVIPADSQYTLAENLEQLILEGARAELEDDRFVGELHVNGVAHTFTAFDLRFVHEDVLNECASVLETERGKAGGMLLAAMFANRYPFEE